MGLISSFMNAVFRRKRPNPYTSMCLAIPTLCLDENRRLTGSPDMWQFTVISTSFGIGMALNRFDKEFAEEIYGSMDSGCRDTGLTEAAINFLTIFGSDVILMA